MFQEGAKEPFSPLERSTMMSRGSGQHPQVEVRLIGHRVGFQVTPNVFHGIWLRCQQASKKAPLSASKNDPSSHGFSSTSGSRMRPALTFSLRRYELPLILMVVE